MRSDRTALGNAKLAGVGQEAFSLPDDEPVVLAARRSFPATDFKNRDYKAIHARVVARIAELEKNEKAARTDTGSGKTLIEMLSNGLGTLSEKDRIQKIVSMLGHSTLDTGKTEVQIACATARMIPLQAHLTRHNKDEHSRRGLRMLAAHRRRLLQYLKREAPDRYAEIVKKIGLRDIS